VNTRFRFKAALTCIALALLITPALLFAHARLVRSSPAINARLSEPPVSLSLWFSERPELRFTSIELVDSAGTVIPHGPIVSIDSMGVSAPIIASLKPGRYSIAWRTAAADGHGTSGRFVFFVGGDPAQPVVAQRDTVDIANASARDGHALVQTGGGSGFTISVRWAELVAAITLIGAVAFRLFVLARAEWPAIAVRDGADRTRRLAMAVLLLFMLTTVMRLVAESDLMPMPASVPRRLAISMLMQTHWGFGWLVGFVGALLIGGGLVVARAALVGWMVVGLGVVGVCVGEALTGHAGSIAAHPALSVATDVAHFLGAGGWIGGLTCLVLCGLPALRSLDVSARDVAGARLIRAYHRSAMECVVVVVASALIAAWLRLGAFSDLWTTDYGSMLFRKIVFVLAAMGLGAYHWRTAVIPDWTSKTGDSFRRTAIAELVIGAIIIAFTTLLVSTALPHRP
jgi:methionine-rich copper-binding protein CopC/putative copper export protein